MRAPLAALALALAACTTPYVPPGGSIYNTDVQRQLYGPGNPVFGGTQVVFAYGSPVGGLTPEDFAARLRIPAWFQPTAFRAAAPGERAEGVRFVAVFGTDLNAFVCSRPAPGGDPALLAMAYCYGDTEVTRASIRFGGQDLDRQLGIFMRALLPFPRPDDTGPCLRRTGC